MHFSLCKIANLTPGLACSLFFIILVGQWYGTIIASNSFYYSLAEWKRADVIQNHVLGLHTRRFVYRRPGELSHSLIPSWQKKSYLPACSLVLLLLIIEDSSGDLKTNNICLSVSLSLSLSAVNNLASDHGTGIIWSWETVQGTLDSEA